MTTVKPCTNGFSRGFEYLEYEDTDQGPQTLVPGVQPVKRQAVKPSKPRPAQKPCNVGLFDEDARNQKDLF